MPPFIFHYVLITGLLLWRSVFSPRPVHVRLVVDKSSLERGSLQLFQPSYISTTTTPVLHTFIQQSPTL